MPKSLVKNIWLVTHPHDEPKLSTAKKVCAWNMSSKHKRKLIESQHAQYLNSINDKIVEGTIYFAGEWECCSFYRKNNNNSSTFINIHNPIFTELDFHPRVLNTDPFVLGKKFYYTCCKTRKKMKAGDMVIFGSTFGNGNKHIRVDTVLIIEGVVNRFNNQQVFFSSGYQEVTLSKMPLMKDVFVGQMYEDSKELFSFVPCRTDSAFVFPVISVMHNGISLYGGSNPNHLEVCEIDFIAIYNKIVADITKQNYCLGVYMPMPTFVQAQAPKSPESYDYHDYYGRSTHRTTSLDEILQ